MQRTEEIRRQREAEEAHTSVIYHVDNDGIRLESEAHLSEQERERWHEVAAEISRQEQRLQAERQERERQYEQLRVERAEELKREEARRLRDDSQRTDRELKALAHIEETRREEFLRAERDVQAAPGDPAKESYRTYQDPGKSVQGSGPVDRCEQANGGGAA